MKRSGPPRRRTALPRNGKRIKTRRVTTGGRGSLPEKIAWLHGKPCAASYSDEAHCSGGVEVHHERRRGERASDERCFPLCVGHHQHDGGPHARHRIGPAAFAQLVGGSLEEVCAAYHVAWETHERLPDPHD